MDSRNDLIKKSYSLENMSYANVSSLFNISRQRVHQIVSGKNYYKYKKNTKGITYIPDKWKPNELLSSIGIKLQGKDFLREIVRRRDNHTCQICGKVWEREKRRLDVHHLDENLEGKVGEVYKNNKDFDRMITLCHKCHLNLHHLRNNMGNKVINNNS